MEVDLQIWNYVRTPFICLLAGELTFITTSQMIAPMLTRSSQCARRSVFAFVGWLVLTGPVGAQQGDRAATGGTVMGVVINQVTGKPMPDVRLMAMWAAGPPWGHLSATRVRGGTRIGDTATTSDADGRFIIRDISEEKFLIRVDSSPGSAVGFGGFGQATWDGEDQFLTMKPGEIRRDVIVPYFPFGVVSGRVTDEIGRPMAGAQVEIYHQDAEAGRRQIVGLEEDMHPAPTDADGRYRFLHPPGPIFVGVTTREWRAPAADDIGRVEAMVFPPVIAPDAKPLIISPGSQSTVDFPLHTEPGFEVSGVVEERGSPIAGAAVYLSDDELAVGGRSHYASLSALTDREGRFRIHAAPAGDYLLVAEVRPGPSYVPPTKQSITRLTVDNAPLRVAVEMRAAPHIRGRFVFDGAKKPLLEDRGELKMSVSPAHDHPASEWPHFSITDDRPREPPSQPAPTTFDLPIAAGRYVLGIHGDPPPGWMVRSIEVAGRNVTDVPIEVIGDINDVVVTFTDRPTEFRARLTVPANHRAGAIVSVFPVNPSRWLDYGSSPCAGVIVGVDYTHDFAIDRLPAGEYFAIALSWEDSYRLRDARDLAAASRLATRFAIAEGERRTLDLDLMKLPAPSADDWKPDEIPPISAPPTRLLPMESQPDAKSLGTITGRILAADTGQPVANAIVSAYDWGRSGANPNDDVPDNDAYLIRPGERRLDLGSAASTDSDGVFTIKSLPSGQYSLWIGAPGFAGTPWPAEIAGQTRQPVAVRANATTSIQAIPMLRSASLTGIVTDEQGRPMQRVEIDIEGMKRISFTLVTDDRGVFTATGLQPGTFGFHAAVFRDYSFLTDYKGAVELRAGQTTTVELTLRKQER